LGEGALGAPLRTRGVADPYKHATLPRVLSYKISSQTTVINYDPLEKFDPSRPAFKGHH